MKHVSPLEEFTVETCAEIPGWSTQLTELEDAARAVLSAAGYEYPAELPDTFGPATIEGAAHHVLEGAWRIREIVARDQKKVPLPPATPDSDAFHVAIGTLRFREAELFGRMHDAVAVAITVASSYALMRTLQREKDLKVGRQKRELPAKLGKERQVATPEAVERWRRMAVDIRAKNPNIHPTRWKAEVARRIAKLETVAVNTVRSAL